MMSEDLICHTCKNNLNANDKNNLDYAMYNHASDSGYELEIICKGCIIKESNKDPSEFFIGWAFCQQQWDFDLSNIEKLFYDYMVTIRFIKKEPYYRFSDKKWQDIDICYRWRLVQAIEEKGLPEHSFTDRTCTDCKKTVNNSEKLEYGYYQWGIQSEILCRDCIIIDKDSDKHEWWSITKHVWRTKLSLIDKMFSEPKLSLIEKMFFASPDDTQYLENRLDKKEEFEDWEKLDVVHQWCIVRRYVEFNL